MATVKEQVESQMQNLTVAELEELSPMAYAKSMNGSIKGAAKTIAAHVGKVRKCMLEAANEPAELKQAAREKKKQAKAKAKTISNKEKKALLAKGDVKKGKKKKSKAKSRDSSTHGAEEQLMIDLLKKKKSLGKETKLKVLREAFVAAYGDEYNDYQQVQSIIWRLRRRGVLNFKKDGNTSLWYVVDLKASKPKPANRTKAKKGKAKK